MAQRLGHRLRWAAVWILLVAWLAALILDIGDGATNVLLVIAVVVLFYELLAADRASGPP